MIPNATAARGAAPRGQRTASTSSASENTAAHMKHFNASMTQVRYKALFIREIAGKWKCLEIEESIK